MATNTSVMRRLRTTVLRTTELRDGEGCTDAELLGAFLAERDELAFELLVRRHGAMVLGVCRRVLGRVHDAEDAFQATFLVLAHKANSIVPREAVGHWLYGVAYRTALKARSLDARRQAKERQVKDMPRPDRIGSSGAVRGADFWDDLEPLLDEELSRLPEKYQVPLVLCHLEGQSKKEIASRLGVPEGTVSSRLARAREMLRQRLSRRGLAVTLGPLVAALSHGAASAAPPITLVDSTVHAASLCAAGKLAAPLVSAKVAALTQGVLKAMFLSKLKIMTALVLTLGLAVSGASIVTLAAFADAPKPEAKKAADGDKPKPKADAKPGENKPPKPEGKAAGIVATVESVDPAKGTITISIKGKDGSKTVDVAKDATIKIDGKDAKLADLKQGAHVRLNVTRVNKDDPPLVTGISVEPAASGTKPAGTGNNNTPKPAGTGNNNTPKPEGTGNNNTPKPAGTGNNNNTKPEGNGGTQPPK